MPVGSPQRTRKARRATTDGPAAEAFVPRGARVVPIRRHYRATRDRAGPSDQNEYEKLIAAKSRSRITFWSPPPWKRVYSMLTCILER